MTEREQFEAAMSAFLDPARVEETFYREGDYYNAYATMFAWEAWQAALATPADHSVPVVIQPQEVAEICARFAEIYLADYGNGEAVKNACNEIAEACRDWAVKHCAAPQPPQNAADHIEAQSVPVDHRAIIKMLEGYAESYEMMARMKPNNHVRCSSVAFDIRNNMAKWVREHSKSDAQSVRDTWISVDDFAALFAFNNQVSDSEADGYTASKETMKRLAELGVVQSLGFGRYGVTAFGSWLIESEFEQSPSLPLRTVSEHNERETAGHRLYMKESAPHSTAWVELPDSERESWRRKSLPAPPQKPVSDEVKP